MSLLSFRPGFSHFTGLPSALAVAALLAATHPTYAFASGAAVRAGSPSCTTAAASISIGTYNIENFWDDVPGNSVPYADYGENTSNWYDDQVYLTKAKHVAEAIRLAGAPDILALEELESGGNESRSLELLKPEIESMGYRYFALGMQNQNDPTAVTTGVISKFPIVSNERLDFSGTDSGDNEMRSGPVVQALSSARDPQVVTVNVNGVLVRIYASHWKSRLGDFASGDNMRFAISKLIKSDIDTVRAQNPALDIVVMGDFNSDQSERPLRDGMKLTDKKESLKNLSSASMYDLWSELPEAERCSYVYKGQRQCIDHILVNSSAFDGKGIDLKNNSFHVVGHGDDAASVLLGTNGSPARWQERKKNGYTTHPGVGYSDHLPLVAQFSVNSSAISAAPSRPCN